MSTAVLYDAKHKTMYVPRNYKKIVPLCEHF